MDKNKCCDGRKTCGTCRWYDGLGDLFQNHASQNEWEHMEPGEKCGKWEKDE